jgi:hypothetical protein
VDVWLRKNASNQFVALYVKVILYVFPAVVVNIGLLKAMYPFGLGLLQLVTLIFPARVPANASVVVVKVATLPDPPMLMRQGETEPVSKPPFVIKVPVGMTANVVPTIVKLRSIRSNAAVILLVTVFLLLFCSFILIPPSSRVTRRMLCLHTTETTILLLVESVGSQEKNWQHEILYSMHLISPCFGCNPRLGFAFHVI